MTKVGNISETSKYFYVFFSKNRKFLLNTLIRGSFFVYRHCFNFK